MRVNFIEDAAIWHVRVGRGECPGAEEGRDVADGEAVQTQMTLLGNTDEPGFSANR
jgi:hypothetical protein